ncbi:MAG: UDP binding domain-containing protein, partial [Pseudomonadota bacterium]
SRSVSLSSARVGVLGLTFKPNVPDIRNSKVPDILAELREYGVEPLISDPLASAEEALHEYTLDLSPDVDVRDLDALVLAVDHEAYVSAPDTLLARLKPKGVLIDVKSALDPALVGPDQVYWSL